MRAAHSSVERIQKEIALSIFSEINSPQQNGGGGAEVAMLMILKLQTGQSRHVGASSKAYWSRLNHLPNIGKQEEIHKISQMGQDQDW